MPENILVFCSYSEIEMKKIMKTIEVLFTEKPNITLVVRQKDRESYNEKSDSGEFHVIPQSPRARLRLVWQLRKEKYNRAFLIATRDEVLYFKLKLFSLFCGAQSLGEVANNNTIKNVSRRKILFELISSLGGSEPRYFNTHYFVSTIFKSLRSIFVIVVFPLVFIYLIINVGFLLMKKYLRMITAHS